MDARISSQLNELLAKPTHEPKPIKIEQFIPSTRIHVPDEHQSHDVEIVSKRSKHLTKPASFWFKKTLFPLERSEALRESYAQEIFRLLDPAQPKARTAFDADGNAYVFIREVLGFSTLQALFKANTKETYRKLKFGHMTNLGTITGSSLLTHELDFKPQNFGPDEDNIVVKIDGGWCFGRLLVRELKEVKPTWNYIPLNPKSKITAQVIEELPALNTTNVYAFHFGYQIKQGAAYKSKRLFTYLDDKKFKQELYQNLLKQYLTPNRYFRAISECHASALLDKMILHTAYVEIANRRLQIMTALLESEAFRQYVLTEDAALVLKQHDEYLHQDGKVHFKMQGKTSITHHYQRAEFNADFELLRQLSAMDVTTSEWDAARSKFLLTQLADIPPNGYGETPLHFAAMNDNSTITNIILKFANDAIINAKTIYGDTPLMIAIMEGNYEVAELLLETMLIDVTAVNRKNQTALLLAYEKIDFDMCMKIICRYHENQQIEGVEDDVLEDLMDYAMSHHCELAVSRLTSGRQTYKKA